MPKTTRHKEPELLDFPPEEKLERLDVVVRDVLSVSNVTVRKKMDAEKRKRARAKHKKR